MASTKIGILRLKFHDLVCNQVFLVRFQPCSFLSHCSNKSPIPGVLNTKHIAQIGVIDVDSFSKRRNSPEIVNIPSGLVLLCDGLILHEDRIDAVGNRVIFVQSIRDVFQLLLSVVSVKGTAGVNEVPEEGHKFGAEVCGHVGEAKSLSVL